MQVSQLGEVTKTSKKYYWFKFIYIANNLINSKGCEFLAKAEWPLI